MSTTPPGMPDEDKQRHGRSFDDAVQLYERARPTYPADAVAWLVPPTAHEVLDLAAGTGKLTRVLLAAGHTVTAVEPLDGMRTELSRQLPRVRALAGTAERIPVPDASQDAVLVGQAWHWFDESAAVPEVTRVLRPGGALGLVWNDMDSAAPWVERLREVTGEAAAATRYGVDAGYGTVPWVAHMRERTGEPDTWRPPLGPEFGEPEWATFRHVHSQDLDTLLAGLSSRSYMILLPEAEREAILGRVAEMLRTHPDTAGRDTYELPYVTRCMRALKHP